MVTEIILNFHEFWKSRKSLPVHTFLKNSWLCKLIYICLSQGLRKSKLFMGTNEIEVQCSIVGSWCHLRMLLSPLMWLNIVKICMLMIRRVYLTPLRNYYYFASGIDLWSDYQLITFHTLWFQHAPELSKEVDCEGKWDGSISHTGLEKSFPSNVCFFQCRRSGSSGVKWRRNLFNENSQVDGPGECSILDRTAIPQSHHSKRLFRPQLNLQGTTHSHW